MVDTSQYHAQVQVARWLSEIVRQAQEAIIAKTVSGRIESWNEGAERTFGYTAKEAIGKGIFEMIPDELHDEERRNLAMVASGTSVGTYETLRRNKEGAIFSVSVSLSPIRNATGRVVGVSSVANDTTELKRAQSALQQTLRQREQFLALLSHELRNPLMAMQSAASILEAEGPKSAVRDEAVASICRQIDQIGILLDDRLNASRLRRDRVEIAREPMDLRDTVGGVLDVVAPAAKSRGIKIAPEIADDALWVNGDASRLEQLQVNLLMNAVRYSKPGGTVDYELRAADRRAIVRIRDYGVGMTQDVLARAFEPFYQGDHDGGEGVGLGLALAKSIVDGHAGSIVAESGGPGQGSTFEFSIGLAPGIDSKVPPPAAAANLPGPTEPRTILLIDDDDDGREALALLLRHRGHSVFEEDCGVGAVAAMIGAEFDVAIVDLGLPDISGLEVAKQVSRQIGLVRPRLIALTGFGQAKDLAATEAAGFDAHLVKPIRLDVIDREIDKAGVCRRR